MRWSIIRLIWLRELRDQVRDRRTLFMIVVLPMLLYPVLGYAALKFATGFMAAPCTVAIAGANPAQGFPPRIPPSAGLSPVPVLAWLGFPAVCPAGPGIDRLAGAAGLASAGHLCLDYPLLVNARPSGASADSEPAGHAAMLADMNVRLVLLADEGGAALRSKQVDLVLSAGPDFWERIENGDRPEVRLQGRDGDDRSRQATQRVYPVLARWKKHVTEVRLIRRGLPNDFDEPFTFADSAAKKAPGTAAAESLFGMMVRIFPFMLVMWSLAGALYPAVDVCAGEKERGTMETLLISPAGREEIVLGKFLTIWVFSAGTSIMNLASMGVSTWQFSQQLPHGALSVAALSWCVLLALPLSAFFSAVSLAIGAYARSSKEGQYYLMPLFLVTMPLIFLTLAPGVELNPFYSMVPVTGVALLMQRLMTSAGLEQVPWPYFVPVLAPVALYSWLALRWAIDQFQREEVLFREAERLDLGLWLRRLFRDKEATPTVGQALFCFGLLLALRWLTLGLGGDLPLVARNVIVLLAFVAAPPLFMALLLTTRPRRTLGLRLPRFGYMVVALLLVPLAELAHYAMNQFPGLMAVLQDRLTMIASARALDGGEAGPWWEYVLVLALLPAVCKELAFRGFILTGLRRRFPAWTAILLSSFLFAAFHMNVFMLVPAFLLGVALGVLAVRCGSVLPGMILHFAGSLLLLGGPLLQPWLEEGAGSPEGALMLLTGLATLGSVLAIVLFLRLHRDGAAGSSLAALLGMSEASAGASNGVPANSAAVSLVGSRSLVHDEDDAGAKRV
jgi:sodium transport system permease protein